MKLLIVFVSALVLVAQGKAAPSKDQEKVNEVQSEVVAGFGEGLQGAFAEEALAVYEPEDVGAGPEQRTFAVGDPAADPLYIPILTRACTNSACLSVCNLLGYPKGVCVSTTTCQCYF